MAPIKWFTGFVIKGTPPGMTQGVTSVLKAKMPVYLSVCVRSGEKIIRDSDNNIIFEDGGVIMDDELEYLVNAINFYERHKLLDGTR